VGYASAGAADVPFFPLAADGTKIGRDADGLRGLVFGLQGVLALYSAIFAFLFIVMFDSDSVFHGKLFVGWDAIVVLITAFQGLQGRSFELRHPPCRR
jgi:hypothetical protein